MNKYEEALTQLVMYAPIEEEPIPSEYFQTLGELVDFIIDAEHYCPEQLRQIKKGIATCKKKEIKNE